jgi:hypothetical protein
MSATHWTRKVDAYLLWGIRTQFRHLQPLIDLGGSGSIGLLAQWTGGDITPTNQGIDALIKAPDDALRHFDRVELANPVAHDRKNLDPATFPGIEDRLVLGVIDDGFPFAQPQWRGRLPLLWDQNGPRTLIPPGYGRVWYADQMEDLVQQQSGVRLPEDTAAYRAAAMRSLRQRATHGAHIMDLLGGHRPPHSRVSDSRQTLEPGRDGSATTAPDWRASPDAASAAPVVCVQLPRGAIEDPTGRWLGLHALDGIDFILNALSKTRAEGQTVAINLSWGPQTGPHDGSSLMEQAIQARVMHQLMALKRLVLISLPAGNSHAARAHAEHSAAAGGEIIWRVPPGYRAPSFLELWWPAHAAGAQAQVQVIAPDGRRIVFPHPSDDVAFEEPTPAVSLTRVMHGQRPMVLLALAPTAPSASPAPHGAWRIQVLPAPGVSGSVHAYVARQSANMGARRRGPDSHLFDPAYELERQTRCFPDEVATSHVRREGTLNGIATGKATIVVGGSVLNRSKLGGSRALARYSASGSGAGPLGRNPNVAFFADESPALPGLRASGVRAGTSVRLVGTSAAAPQYARRLLCVVNKTCLPVEYGKPEVPLPPERAGTGIVTPIQTSGTAPPTTPDAPTEADALGVKDAP